MAKIKLNKACSELKITSNEAIDFFKKHGIEIVDDPNTRLEENEYMMLVEQFDKQLAAQMRVQKEKELTPKNTPAEKKEEEPEIISVDREKYVPKVKGHIDLDAPKAQKNVSKEEKPATAEPAEIPVETPVSEAPIEEPVKEIPQEELPQEEQEPKKQDTPKQNEKKSKGEKNKRFDTTIDEDGNEVIRLRNENLDKTPKIIGTIDLDSLNQSTHPAKKTKEEREKERDERYGKKNKTATTNEKRKRERIRQNKVDIDDVKNQKNNNKNKNKTRRAFKTDISAEEVEKQIKETYSRLLNQKGKTNTSKYKRERRELEREKMAAERQETAAQSKILKLTEFVTVNDLAVMMDVPVVKIIGACMSLGLMVSINQRLDAETINMVAEEFGFSTEYVSTQVVEEIHSEDEKYSEEDMQRRAPIVTVMGHVDHGKTSLLDHIRNTNVIAGEAGGITQHIGAYNVKLKNGQRITFLDTPGHEAFTAMRARGAQVTDIAIIIIAADDAVMPQTIEAINHAQAAGVPMIFAINKCDKPGVNPDKIKEQLANMNILVEDWGGKYQCQNISAKQGTGVYELLEKVLLEAEMLDLRANPKRRAKGSIIESSLDKGRGYVATVLVSDGTLHVGDVVLAGIHYGRVKAMFNERGQKVEEVAPGEPCLFLGLNGAPQAGDEFVVLPTEQEARELANKREQLQREQSIRTKKHLGLDEIGRRLAIGDFKELNIIVKGDVDGSVEALSDSLIKLSTENIQVNVIHKAVGAISDSDILLAEASNAIVVGFQVRPTATARKLAEKEEIDIRIYSIIYDALEEIKAAMAGMLSPDIKEEITGTAEVLQTFNISKVGTIAGCIVREGKIRTKSKCRVIRDGIVIHSGELASLKRNKDDVKEVGINTECGLNVKSYNDIQVGDAIEAFEQIEVAKEL